MDQELREHYLQLWRLSNSLRKDWWEKDERDKVEQLLKDAAAHDPNLSGLNPGDPGFFEDLSLKLSSLVISKPEISQANLPQSAMLKIWAEEREKHLKTLTEQQDNIPLAFLDKNNHQAGIPREDIYLILKKHRLVDNDGSFDLSDSSAVAKAQEEIGLQSAYYQSLTDIRRGITEAIEDSRTPVSLFMKQTFGEDTPGLIEAAAERVAQRTKKEFEGQLRTNLGGQPISLTSSGVTQAVTSAASSLKTTAITRKLFNRSEAKSIVETFLAASPRFQILDQAQQDMLTELLAESVYVAAADPNLTPREINDILIQERNGRIVLKTTPIIASVGPGEESQYQAVHVYNPSQEKNVSKIVSREINMPLTVATSKKMQDTLEGFAKDPLSALTYYPFHSFIQLLPAPIKDLYFRNTGWQDSLKSIKKAYAVSISPEAQRNLLEKWIGQGIKSILRPSGLVNEKGQWIWVSAIGWVGEKIGTGIGEGFSNLFSRIPFVGKTLGKIISRRIGKHRRRDENYLAGIAGIFLDASLALMKILPTTAWKLLNKTKFFKNFKAGLLKNYVSLEARYGLFRTFRMATEFGKSFAKAIFSLNTVAGGLLGYALTGSPFGAFGGGFAGIAYQTWLNIAKNGRFLGFLTRPANVYLGFSGPGGKLIGATKLPADNFVDKTIKFMSKPGVFMANHGWARLPLKGIAVGYFLAQAGVPWYLAYTIPPALDWLWQTRKWWGGKLGRLFLGSKVGSGMGKVASSIFGKLGFFGRIFGFLGKLLSGILGKILFAVPFIPLLIDLLSGVPAGAALAHWFSGGLFSWGTAGIISISIPLLGGFIPALFGYASVGTMLSAGASALAAALGTSAAAAAAMFAGAVVILTASTMFVVIITSSAMFEGKGLRKELISSYIPITKSYPALEKDASGNIVALNYTITYGYNPTTDLPVGQLTDVQIRDFFEEPKSLGVHFNEFFSTRFEIGNKGPFSTYTPCEPFRYDNMLLWYKADSLTGLPPEADPSVRETCNEIGPVNPLETKTITMRLVLKKPLNQLLGAKESLCNRLGVSGEVPGKGRQTSSLSPICIDAEGKVVTTPAAALALKIIQELKNCGITNMDPTNIDAAEKCLADANIPQVAIDIMIQSMTVLKFPSVQCLSFIEAVEAATGGKLHTYGLGTAKLYWTSLPDYQQIDASDYNNITIGDILVWTTGEAGHVAIVTRPIYDSGGQLVKVEIAENLGTTTQGQMNIREIPVTSTGIDSAGLAGWQRRK